MTEPLLTVEDLRIEYQGADGTVRPLDGVDLSVDPGEIVGIAGESGSGKSTLAASIGRILDPGAKLVGGGLTVAGSSVFDADEDELRRLRREVLGFIFQTPIAVMDPTARVGRQLSWSAGLENGSVAAALEQVGLGPEVVDRYPHQLSGGMAQRVMIAKAMGKKPRLLIADEPTASLDASIRSAILDLLLELTRASGAALVLFSHDLPSLIEYTDKIGVMYSGRLVELAPAADLRANPRHPYTQALFRSAPGTESFGETLEPIPGAPMVLDGPLGRCSFAARCPFAQERCWDVRPEMREVGGHRVVCHRAEEIAG